MTGRTCWRGGEGLAHELADGGVRESVNAEVRIAKFSQFVIRHFPLRHHLHPSLFAVCKFEDVLLSGGDEREALGGFAGRPLVPVEAVHQVAVDAVFLQHHGDVQRAKALSICKSLPAGV